MLPTRCGIRCGCGCEPQSPETSLVIDDANLLGAVAVLLDTRPD
jgi:hypothetical protein